MVRYQNQPTSNYDDDFEDDHSKEHRIKKGESKFEQEPSDDEYSEVKSEKQSIHKPSLI